MSWLRRIFGGQGRRHRASAQPTEPRRAHERDEGPVYGRADVPLERAKAQLLALLHDRGARSAGEDLGSVPSLSQWLSAIVPEPWMMRSRRLSRELEEAAP